MDMDQLSIKMHYRAIWMVMDEVSMLMHGCGPVIDKDTLKDNMDGHA